MFTQFQKSTMFIQAINDWQNTSTSFQFRHLKAFKTTDLIV